MPSFKGNKDFRKRCLKDAAIAQTAQKILNNITFDPSTQ